MRQFILAFFTILIALVLGYTAHAQTGIVLEDADAQWTTTTTPGTELSQSLSGVSHHIIVDTAPGLSRIMLTQTLPDLQAELNQVSAQILLDQANSNKTVTLTQPATGLRNLFSTILSDLIIDQANSNKKVGLTYPFDLIDDQSPPTALTPEIQPTDPGILITWDSNEFTRFVLRYGTSPGTYTESVTETLYSLQHEVELTTLQDGQTYYFIIESEDISGNKSTTNEQKIEVSQPVLQFLPSLQR